ncbi:MAG: hypothetical protein L0L26_11425 [Corynebacterium variabile]|uniref:hypothetical protein n=1 Tax=Corynebacterium variabile TaxID=1727 RepID=UPI0026473924|nr:hypothetical protein [Corynebacterium variabile]MDN6662439.1 hypothetical protein [Corynebacterium variabile]
MATTAHTLFSLITSPTLPEDFSENLDAAILRERAADRDMDTGPDRTPAQEEVTTVSGMTAGQEHAFELFLLRPSTRRRREEPPDSAAA